MIGRDDLTPEELLTRCRELADEVGLGAEQRDFFFGDPLSPADLDELADDLDGLFGRITPQPNTRGAAAARQRKEGR